MSSRRFDFPSRRAAEEFDRVLSGEAPAESVERFRDLTDTVTRLGQVATPEPRPGFVANLRDRLIATAEAEWGTAGPDSRPDPARVPAPAATPTRRASATRRRLGTVVAGIAIVGGTTGMAVAASGAVPGDPIYPIKRGLEQVRISAATGSADTGRARLDQAQERLAELDKLARKDDVDSSAIAVAADDFQESAEEGADDLFSAYDADGDERAGMREVRDFAATSMATLERLAARADEVPQLVELADTVTEIDQQARALCGDCADTPPVQPPEELGGQALPVATDSPLVRPVEAAEQLITDQQLSTLRDDAQDSADASPPPGSAAGAQEPLLTDPPAVVPGLPGGVLSPQTVAADGIESGGVLTGVRTQEAVTGMVNGATGTVEEIVDGVSRLTGGATEPLTDPVKEVLSDPPAESSPEPPSDILDAPSNAPSPTEEPGTPTGEG